MSSSLQVSKVGHDRRSFPQLAWFTLALLAIVVVLCVASASFDVTTLQPNPWIVGP